VHRRPRKEFFLLAAASAAGVPFTSGTGAGEEAQSTLPPGTKPLLVYNRSAGAYWLNQTLVQSDEAGKHAPSHVA
jgi:hypothetical protein